MRISIGETIVVENVETGVFGINAVRVAGEATDQQPARLVFLHRHADMADEKTADDATSEVERGADYLAGVLASVDTRVTASDLSAVIESAQHALKDIDTYYSVLVAMVVGRSVVAAGIGNMNMLLWEGDAVRLILRATMSLLGNT
jgi:predicted RecB family endonuclease